MSILSDAAKLAQETDDAWGAALRLKFGKRAGDERYRAAGKGEPGSELRRLYEAREAARIAFDRAYGRDEYGMPLKGAAS